MNTINITKRFSTDEKCLDYLEKMRWPMGVACPKCGSQNVSRVTRSKASKNKRARLYECLEKECGHQFSATSGTIFHDTHLPLTTWFMAIALVCEAKKGISACQLQRNLGVSYRTAWYLAHRIREAMKEGDFQLTGVVEADETYLHPRRKRLGQPRLKNPNRDAVIGMIERGGRLRLFAAQDGKMRSVEPLIVKHVHPDATLQTDESAVYHIIGLRRFPGRHRQIAHNLRHYAEGENHTQSIENAFSLLKRGVYGTFHKVSIKHLGRYCDEFSYRFNRRGEQGSLFEQTAKGLAKGEALPFKRLTASAE